MQTVSYIEQNWEAKNKPKILSLEPYRHLFPKALGVDKTVEPNAGVAHTVAFIPQVVIQSAWQVENYVAQELKGLSLYDACQKLWHFVRFHIEWVKDQDQKEQVRTPRRLIRDGKGDCDCMTTFVDTCMHVYGVKGIVNRITAYEAGHFQHIYTLIPNEKGGYYIIDCCVPKFNYEKPYTKKEDNIMELQLLDGIGETNDVQNGSYADIFGGSDLGELGKLFKRKNSGGAAAPAKKALFKRTPEKKAAAKQKRQNFGKKLLKVANVVNKINPATVLLRAGILASMKLNVMKVAEKIKWGYATKEYAASKGMDMSKYDKVRAVLAKTEQIFYTAGGKKENLKKAILTGRGNKGREVKGIEGLSDDMSLAELLGDIFNDEFVNGMEGFEGFGFEGFGDLGEPATAASVAAASTAMGTLAALLKSIGDLFPNKGKTKPAKEKKGIFKRKAAPVQEIAPSDEPPESLEPSTQEEAAPSVAEDEAPQEEVVTENEEEAPQEQEENMEVTPSEDVPNEESENSEEAMEGILSGPFAKIATFYQKNKKWIIPAGIVAGVAILGTGIYFMTKKGESKQVPNNRLPTPYSINGVPKRGRRTNKQKSLDGTQQGVIELM